PSLVILIFNLVTACLQFQSVLSAFFFHTECLTTRNKFRVRSSLSDDWRMKISQKMMWMP
ncbi:hypothetical protein CJZ35_24895, partial [Salmonella enterica subsp. enterica serovar Braenderup]